MSSKPGTPAKPKAQDKKKSKDVQPQPSFFNYVLVPFALAPIVFAGLIYLSTQLATVWFAADPQRPPFLTLPFVGGSLFPGVVGTTIYLLKSSALNFLPKFLKKFIAVLPTIVFILHNFFTVFYGNINNDAWSNSIVIDVIAPLSAFNSFVRLPSFIAATENTTAWAHESIISGPHLDIQGVHDAQCGPRAFGRFMYHRILPKSRVHAILAEGVMFGGIWLMAAPTDSRSNSPKVFTDHAYGNDAIFNNLMRWLLVDEFNWYSEYRFDTSDSEWNIDSGLIPAYNNGSVAIRTSVGAQLGPQHFIMDQYSCMSESNWLYSLAGFQWCFYKNMYPTKAFELSGSIQHPLLAGGNLTFPSGSATDCSQPYVRAALANGLHWIRPTYKC